MKKQAIILFIAVLLGLTSFTLSAASTEGLEHSGANIRDTASLQRGAKWYVNYCMGCHSLQYVRYNRLAEDLGISEDMLMQNLVFSNAKFEDTMKISMQPKQSKAWFGKTPPDLSLTGRSRGPDWVYTYLKGFYQDENGEWNNTMLPNLSMPNVLWSLQGIQTPVYRQETTDGYTHEVIDHFELTREGAQSPEEFDQTARDIATFLDYAGEPAKLKRKHVGVWVILFLAVFTFLAFLLKAEYWRDVH